MTAEQWFVVPVAGSGELLDPYRAKYRDTDGIESTTGTPKDFSAEKWSELPWYPNEMFVVRFYGTQSAIDAVAANADAYGKQEYSISDAEVAEYLNDKTGLDRTFAEWTSAIENGNL